MAQRLSQAVDDVRRKEHKALRAAGGNRLAGTRYDWLRNPAIYPRNDELARARW